jgi:ferrochelatase
MKNGRLSGVCLINLGTPELPERKSVARFLRRFLSDPRVIDLPRYLWLPLLNLVIIPLRAGRSAAAYRKIWLPEGSPLLVLTQRLASRLGSALDGIAMVETGMRYSEPSIRNSLERLRKSGVDEVVILPLYPQYSLTTTASIYDSVDESLAGLNWQPRLHRLEQYYEHPLWVEAVASSIREFRAENGASEKLIFSLHGIPQRYVDQGDPYQDQCQKSVRAIVTALGLDDDEWLLTYQSRVGREPWLQPYTSETLKTLGSSGTRRVQVICPGFAVDCLETLEEIAMQNREFFEQAGGQKLEYIPALNDSEAHAGVMKALVLDNLQRCRDAGAGVPDTVGLA